MSTLVHNVASGVQAGVQDAVQRMQDVQQGVQGRVMEASQQASSSLQDAATKAQGLANDAATKASVMANDAASKASNMTHFSVLHALHSRALSQLAWSVLVALVIGVVGVLLAARATPTRASTMMRRARKNLIVYYDPRSHNSMRVLLFLKESGLPFECRMVDIFKGEHKDPNFKRLNPRTQVPVLVDGDVVLNESTAIIDYLSRVYPTNLVPSNSERLALNAKYIAEFHQKLDPKNIFHAVNFDRAKREHLRDKTDALLREARVWDDYLEGKKYLTGDSIATSDIVAFPLFEQWFEGLGLPEQDFPNLAEWVDRIKRRKSARELEWFQEFPSIVKAGSDSFLSGAGAGAGSSAGAGQGQGQGGASSSARRRERERDEDEGVSGASRTGGAYETGSSSYQGSSSYGGQGQTSTSVTGRSGGGGGGGAGERESAWEFPSTSKSYGKESERDPGADDWKQAWQQGGAGQTMTTSRDDQTRYGGAGTASGLGSSSSSSQQQQHQQQHSSSSQYGQYQGAHQTGTSTSSALHGSSGGPSSSTSTATHSGSAQPSQPSQQSYQSQQHQGGAGQSTASWVGSGVGQGSSAGHGASSTGGAYGYNAAGTSVIGGGSGYSGSGYSGSGSGSGSGATGSSGAGTGFSGAGTGTGYGGGSGGGGSYSTGNQGSSSLGQYHNQNQSRTAPKNIFGLTEALDSSNPSASSAGTGSSSQYGSGSASGSSSLQHPSQQQQYSQYSYGDRR